MDASERVILESKADGLRKTAKSMGGKASNLDVFIAMLSNFGRFLPVPVSPRDPKKPLTGRRNPWPGINNADRSIRAQERHNKTYYIDDHGSHRRRFSNRRPGESGRQRRLRVKAQRRSLKASGIREVTARV
jgi:hypothetical protein